MKNLKKILMIAFCFCIPLVMAACNLQKDKNIVSINVVETTIPSYIEVGKFDEAGIKIQINYADQTTETVNVTTAMLGDNYENYLYTPGTYNIQILFRGKTTEITVKVVNSQSVFTVSFYNGNNELVSRQMVCAGQNAVAPTTNIAMSGYTFVCWDRTFTNITSNVDVYGIYTKLEANGTDVAYNEVLFDAVENMQNSIFNVAHIDETANNRTDSTYMYKNQVLGSYVEKTQAHDYVDYRRITSEQTSTGSYVYYKESYTANGYYRSEYSANEISSMYAYAQIKAFVTSHAVVDFNVTYYANEIVYKLTYGNDKGSGLTEIYFNEDQILMVKCYTETSTSEQLKLTNSIYVTLHPTTYVEFPYIPNDG